MINFNPYGFPGVIDLEEFTVAIHDVPSLEEIDTDVAVEITGAPKVLVKCKAKTFDADNEIYKITNINI